MKVITIIILLFLPIITNAQIVTLVFENWKDEPSKEIIEKINIRLITSLERTGFTPSDSIAVTFNYKREYERVTHCIQNEERIKYLYNNIIMHALTLKTVLLNYHKVENLKIFVRLQKGHYLFTDYEDLSLNPVRVRMPEREFEQKKTKSK